MKRTNEKIKLIASDMDGTLLTTDKRLPGDFTQVVRALYEKGVSFCIASGRQYASLRRDLEELVPQLIFIAENGALIMEHDRQLFIDPLDAGDLPRIVRASEGLEQVYPVICRSDCALVDKSASEAFVTELRMYYEQTFVVENLADKCDGFHDVCKVAFYDAGDAATHLLHRYRPFDREQGRCPLWPFCRRSSRGQGAGISGYRPCRRRAGSSAGNASPCVRQILS